MAVQKEPNKVDKNLKEGIHRRIVGMSLLLMMIMVVLITAIIANAIRLLYYQLYSTMGQSLVRTLASEVNGDWLEEYAETFEKDTYYKLLKQRLDRIKGNYTNLEYLYIYKPESDHFVYLMEAMSPSDDPAMINQPGDIYEYGESDYKNLVPDILAQKPSDRVMKGKNVGYGTPIMTWAPIFDSEGNMVAMIEADYILEDIGKSILNSTVIILSVQLLCIIDILVLMLRSINRIVTKPLRKLTDIVDDYESGEIEDDLSGFQNDDEIRKLALSFKEMTRRNAQYVSDLTAVTAEKERIGAELNVAKKIQEDMLPRIFPPYPNRADFEIYASMDPAKEVGGDFYDLFLVDDDHIALVMADVSGKGVPAALFMVITKTLLKNRTMMGGTPAQIVSDVNDQLCEGNESEYFVTVWLAIIDLKTGDGTAVNAGHEHPILKKRDGEYELIKYRHAPPVGSMPGLPFAQREFHLDPGDMLFVYTDGVAEATDANEELYGTESLLEILNSQKQATPEELLHAVKEDVDRFVGEAPQFDDLTMMAFRIVG